MTSNQLIQALIKVLGIAILVWVLIEVPPFVYHFFSTMLDVARAVLTVSARAAFNTFWAASLIFQVVMLAFKALIGFYLLGGGKWFYDLATRDNPVPPR